MLTPDRYAVVARMFPFLKGSDDALVKQFRQAATFVQWPVGKQLFLQGECATALPLVTAGIVRLYKTGRTGREITLYRLGAGEACLLSATAILNGQPLAAAAVVEERAGAVLVPADTLRRWVQEHELWRRFVFQLMADRLVEVLGIVDSVAFRRMDARVAELLLERSGSRSVIRITHQEIASELGTSREVVSRVLESFAHDGVLHVARGRIAVLEPAALADFALA